MNKPYGVVLTYGGRRTLSPEEPARFRHLQQARKELARLNREAWFNRPQELLGRRYLRQRLHSWEHYRYRLYHFGNREYCD